MDNGIVKYPRTYHLKGSRLFEGEVDKDQVDFKRILGKNIVIEEKLDGANTAISFDANGAMRLQNRNHYLDGGGREKPFNLLKQWASENSGLFYNVLGNRYVMYGEWMYAKHTVFYDSLPDYFMEFDIYDRERQVFLDTPSRRRLTETIGIISSVPVLGSGSFKKKEEILSLIGHSSYITDEHIEALRSLAVKRGQDADKICRETELSANMEGLYIKLEEEGEVKERFKYIRPDFLQVILSSESHWLARELIPNQLACGR